MQSTIQCPRQVRTDAGSQLLIGKGKKKSWVLEHYLKYSLFQKSDFATQNLRVTATQLLSDLPLSQRRRK